VQAELLALVQTYRAYHTAVYRRDKLEVAQELAKLNSQLVQALRRQLEANQVPAADVLLTEVENLSARQHVEAARQEYADALAGLRQQIGVVELADSAEPDGKLEAPQDAAAGDEEPLLQTALGGRPEIQTARAEVERSRAALCLARADRIPIPSLGPVYEKDESGSSFYGLAVSSPIPVWNAGARLVAQREAEYHRDAVVLEQTRQRVTVQVKTAMTRWNQAQQLSARTAAIAPLLAEQAARMERLFTAGQTDLVKLLQVRQRWLDAANMRLDATWQATQAYADLLSSVGGVSLLSSLCPQPTR
jgi:cobalt-zinc-cadmium efflux system outer membrane protein